MNFKGVLIIFAIIASVYAEYKSYRNYKVYKTVPETEKAVEFFTELRRGGWYFWSAKISIGGDVRVMVAPERQQEYEDKLSSAGIPSHVLIPDVQKLIDDQLRRPANVSRQLTDYSWDYYQSLEEINAWLDAVAAKHPDVVTVVTIGKSVEGRDIKGVKIDFKKHETPTIGMIEGGIHAREWISPATVTWIIKEFLESKDPDVRLMAENVVWHIFPVVNPDGYAYTFTNNRMWRKNRNTANYTSCAQWNLDSDISNGIDLNRNFGYLWMIVGASQNPCAETFAGPVGFSEPESLAIANYVTTLKTQGNMVYYFAFHSYTQLVLIPYSHVGVADGVQAHNYGDLYEIAIKGMDSLKDKHGTNYVVGTSADILYQVSGSSFDWVHAVANVPIVYLFELRDVGEFGFLLPTEQIIPNNEEIMAGLIKIDKVTEQIGYYNRNGSSRFGLSAVLLVLGMLFVV